MTDTLGKRIAQARREMAVREQRDITRGEVAEAAGVDPSTVSLWEADKKSPRETTLARLAAYLGTTAKALRYGEDQPQPEKARQGKGTIVAGTGAPAAKKNNRAG